MSDPLNFDFCLILRILYVTLLKVHVANGIGFYQDGRNLEGSAFCEMRIFGKHSGLLSTNWEVCATKEEHA